MIIADIHNHTEFSFDSEAPMEGQILSAIEKGMKYLCFTEHIDLYMPVPLEAVCRVQDDSIYRPALPAYMAKSHELADKYKDRITVFSGIEMGMLPKAFNDYRSILKEYPFDFVLGSLHTVDDLDPYYETYWKKHPGSEGVERYFSDLISYINEFDEFDSLAHLDYVIRYCRDENGNPVGRNYRYSDYGDYIDTILKWVISHDKALEVNTAGFKYGLGNPNPRAEVLRRYRELGGERITIGSDGHSADKLCFAFDKAEDLLISLGFTYYEVFKGRKPFRLKLG